MRWRALCVLCGALGLAACDSTLSGGNGDGGGDGPVLTDGPTADVPLSDGPVADTPTTDGPVTSDGPAADAPVTDGPPPADKGTPTPDKGTPPADTGTPPTVEVPGPSAALHASHPYYTCVTNRYVATAANGGSDSNDGTAPTVGGGHGPWLTLSHANSAIPKPAPGYCINIGDGTYNISQSIYLDHGGNQASMTGFTVYRASSLLGAKLVATGSAYSILNAQAPYLIFDGLEIDGKHLPSGDAAGINSCANPFSYSGIHHIIVLNSYIHHMGGNGVAHCWAEYYWVIHNRLDQNAYNSWNSGVSIYEPIVIPGYTPTTYDQRWTPYPNVIAYNRCYGNFTSPAGSPHTDGNGIIYDDTRHEQNAPKVAYAPKALIMGNVAWGNGGFGIQIGPTSSNADVFNNTCYNNGLDTVNTGTWRGEFSSSFGSGNTFKNNIGIAVKGSGILSNNTPFLGGNPVDATNSWSNNIAFGNAPNMVSPDSFPTPANKVSTDPQLQNVSGGNFALKSGSPAIGFGAVVPYWQQQTAGSVDVGACPHSLTSCP